MARPITNDRVRDALEEHGIAATWNGAAFHLWHGTRAVLWSLDGADQDQLMVRAQWDKRARADQFDDLRDVASHWQQSKAAGKVIVTDDLHVLGIAIFDMTAGASTMQLHHAVEHGAKVANAILDLFDERFPDAPLHHESEPEPSQIPGGALTLALSRALQGQAHPSLRQASIETDGDVIRMLFEFDGEPAEDAREAASVAATEAFAVFPGTWQLDETYRASEVREPLAHSAYLRWGELDLS